MIHTKTIFHIWTEGFSDHHLSGGWPSNNDEAKTYVFVERGRLHENAREFEKNLQEKMTMSPHPQGFFGQRNPTILGSV